METSLGSSNDHTPVNDYGLNILTWPRRIGLSNLRVHLRIEGEPISKQRPRFCRTKSGHVYTPITTSQAEDKIKWSIKAAHQQLIEDSESSFGVRVVFHCKGYQRRDIDNMCKLILDACNGFVWKDDKQVEELISHVFRNEPEPYTELAIYVFPDSVRTHQLICDHCKTTFSRPRSLDKGKSGRRFCSKTCQCAYWKPIRVKRAYGICQTCGKPTSKKEYTNCQVCHIESGKFRSPGATPTVECGARK